MNLYIDNAYSVPQSPRFDGSVTRVGHLLLEEQAYRISPIVLLFLALLGFTLTMFHTYQLNILLQDCSQALQDADPNTLNETLTGQFLLKVPSKPGEDHSLLC